MEAKTLPYQIDRQARGLEYIDNVVIYFIK